jgi:hypothetical protein
VTAWEVYRPDLGWAHPVVVVSTRHALRANLSNAGLHQRTTRPPQDHEVVLDQSDGLDWPTFCKCDCIYAVPRGELKKHRGNVALERHRQIVRTIISAHAWNAL